MGLPGEKRNFPGQVRGFMTHEGFVLLLWDGFRAKVRKEWSNRVSPDALGLEGKAGTKESMELAMNHGWVNPQDMLWAERPITRSAAARMLHEFLLRELGEGDEADTQAAAGLKDLYDCRTCVNHVAQVFCKGIMSPWQDGIFGMKEGIPITEAEKIVGRVFARPFPGRLFEEAKDDPTLSCLSAGEVKELLSAKEHVHHVDVRTAWEYANGHPEGAENIPLLRLLEAPDAVDADKNAFLLLGCDGGYRSEMAARCLLAAGYRRVYHYRFEEEN